MKTLIIYNSKTGFTKKYAEWIQEAISCDVISYKQKTTINLDQYDTIIYGSRVYAGMIVGLKWFKETLPKLNNKHTIVFATGFTPSDSEKTKEMLLQNIPLEERNNLPIFYLPSGLCYEKMGVMDKLIMGMVKNMVKKKGVDSEDYKLISASSDLTSKESLQPLLQHIRSLS